MTNKKHTRRILLAVTGLSPQIVTETIYALAIKQQPAFIPTEVHLLTTREGAERARLDLLAGKGWFYKLCKDYELGEITFDADTIHILQDAAGNDLEDIRSVDDNEQAANLITEKVRELTSDPDSALHVSIAGGRKTMGFYLGYALSLFGRPQDRLSHVLVSAPFESHPEFFYPTPYSRVIHSREQKPRPWDASDADVSLAEIPFVSLRQEIPERLLEGKASFLDTINAARKSLETPGVQIDLAGKRLLIQGEPIIMPAACLAFYSMMARRRMDEKDPVNSRAENLAQHYLNEYARLVGKDGGYYEKAEEELLKSDDLKDWFDQRISKTNKQIREALGEQLAKRYKIVATGKRPNTRYGLTELPKEAIEYL